MTPPLEFTPYLIQGGDGVLFLLSSPPTGRGLSEGLIFLFHKFYNYVPLTLPSPPWERRIKDAPHAT